MKFARKTVVVTGGSSGLGLEFCRQLIARGNTVLAVGRDAERLSDARSRIPDLHTFVADVTDPAQRLQLRDYVQTELPACDVLINNAGIMRPLDFGKLEGITEVEPEIAVNLLAPIALSMLFVPILRAGREGYIVNVSSGLAFAPFPLAPVYSATKAAMHSFTQSLRIQLRGSDIRVVEIIPPTLDTPMIAGEFKAAMGGQRLETVERVTSLAIQRIEAGRAEIALGASSMLRMMSRVAPGFLMRQMASMYDRVSAA